VSNHSRVHLLQFHFLIHPHWPPTLCRVLVRSQCSPHAFRDVVSDWLSIAIGVISSIASGCCGSPFYSLRLKLSTGESNLVDQSHNTRELVINGEYSQLRTLHCDDLTVLYAIFHCWDTHFMAVPLSRRSSACRLTTRLQRSLRRISRFDYCSFPELEQCSSFISRLIGQSCFI
jgi:hypothetical protein